MPDDSHKLHIDDDWKHAAQAEKERFAEQVEGDDLGPMPPTDFKGLVSLLAMQAMVGLGGMAGAGGQEIPPNLELAKHYIDMLDVLDQKTVNNLAPDEKRLLDTTLHQLRLAYVEMASALSHGGRGGA